MPRRADTTRGDGVPINPAGILMIPPQLRRVIKPLRLKQTFSFSSFFQLKFGLGSGSRI